MEKMALSLKSRSDASRSSMSRGSAGIPKLGVGAGPETVAAGLSFGSVGCIFRCSNWAFEFCVPAGCTM